MSTKKLSKYIRKQDFINLHITCEANYFASFEELYKRFELDTDASDESDYEESDYSDFAEEEVKESHNEINIPLPIEAIEGRISEFYFQQAIKNAYEKTHKVIDLSSIKDQEEAFTETKRLILEARSKNQNYVIFEATFIAKYNAICKVDAFFINGDKFSIMEFKSATKVKTQYFFDIGYQWCVVTDVLNTIGINEPLIYNKIAVKNKESFPFYNTYRSFRDKIQKKSLMQYEVDFSCFPHADLYPHTHATTFKVTKENTEDWTFSLLQHIQSEDPINEFNTLKSEFWKKIEYLVKIKSELKEIKFDKYLEKYFNSEILVHKCPKCPFKLQCRNIYLADLYIPKKVNGNIFKQQNSTYSSIHTFLAENKNATLKDVFSNHKILTDLHPKSDETTSNKNSKIPLIGKLIAEYENNHKEMILVDQEKFNAKIDQFLSNKSVVWFDFETWNPAVPLYRNVHAYEQIIFQCSVYKNGQINNLIYDPHHFNKSTFYKQIIDAIYEGENALYVVFFQTFESNRIYEIKEYLMTQEAKDIIGTKQCEELIKKASAIISGFIKKTDRELNSESPELKNMYDIAWFFDYKKIGFIPNLYGYYSIKKVLPFIEKNYPQFFKEAGTVSYKTLKINNGKLATDLAKKRYYLDQYQIVKKTYGNKINDEYFVSDEQWEKYVNELKKYCENDVKAMIACWLYINYLHNDAKDKIAVINDISAIKREALAGYLLEKTLVSDYK